MNCLVQDCWNPNVHGWDPHLRLNGSWTLTGPPELLFIQARCCLRGFAPSGAAPVTVTIHGARGVPLQCFRRMSLCSPTAPPDASALRGYREGTAWDGEVLELAQRDAESEAKPGLQPPAVRERE